MPLQCHIMELWGEKYKEYNDVCSLPMLVG